MLKICLFALGILASLESGEARSLFDLQAEAWQQWVNLQQSLVSQLNQIIFKDLATNLNNVYDNMRNRLPFRPTPPEDLLVVITESHLDKIETSDGETEILENLVDVEENMQSLIKEEISTDESGSKEIPATVESHNESQSEEQNTSTESQGNEEYVSDESHSKENHGSQETQSEEKYISGESQSKEKHISGESQSKEEHHMSDKSQSKEEHHMSNEAQSKEENMSDKSQSKGTESFEEDDHNVQLESIEEKQTDGIQGDDDNKATESQSKETHLTDETHIDSPVEDNTTLENVNTGTDTGNKDILPEKEYVDVKH